MRASFAEPRTPAFESDIAVRVQGLGFRVQGLGSTIS